MFGSCFATEEDVGEAPPNNTAELELTMETAGQFATRPSKKIALADDASANAEEVDEQIEEDTVEKEAHENETLDSMGKNR